MGMLPANPSSRVFVSWVKHTTRSASLAAGLGAENFFFFDWPKAGPLKYLARGARTAAMLLRLRPAVVFCMNPPYFLGLLAWLYTLLFRARLVLDSHSAAFDQPEWVRLMPLHRFIARRALCSVVTNAELARRLTGWGAAACVISDIPYEIPGGSFPVESGRFSVCFSCSFAPDEPVAAFLQAARALPEVRFYVTGNSRRAPGALSGGVPDNVTLTGYVSNEAYFGLLRGVNAVMVLTTRDFTMQRGGSEAVGAGKPLVISDWPTLREIFPLGAVHVENTPEGIIAGVRQALRDEARLRGEMAEMSRLRDERWREAVARLGRALESGSMQ
ncbi:MAG: glycosyltransferase family 4 protein [Candidatus Hydrogenedens sp.]|nr:glycosyltransferase [Candidatus Hydrogenedentota bacterium]NLF56307.1 glycosyltransferase family 4 protein [Candidatus Hydrogenedens sp.]